MSLDNNIFSKTASEASNQLAVMYVEAQKSKMNKQAGLLTNSALGALAGAGVGGLGSIGYDYLKGKKLNLRNALYSGLIGSLPGAAIGGLMTEGDPKKNDKGKGGGKGSWADTVRSLNESESTGPLDTLANEAALAGSGIMAAPGNAALAGTGGFFAGRRLAGSTLNFQHPEAVALKSEIKNILDTPRPVAPGLEPTRLSRVANPGVRPSAQPPMIYPTASVPFPNLAAVADPGVGPVAPTWGGGKAYAVNSNSPIWKNYITDPVTLAHQAKVKAFNEYLFKLQDNNAAIPPKSYRAPRGSIEHDNFLTEQRKWLNKSKAHSAYTDAEAAHLNWRQGGVDYRQAVQDLKYNQGKLLGLRGDLDRVLAAKGTSGQTLNGKPGGWTRSGIGGIPGALLAILASGPVSNYMGNYYKKEE